MTNTHKLLCAFSTIKTAGRLADLLKIRRNTPVFSRMEDYIQFSKADEASQKMLSNARTSFYDTNSKSIFTTPGSKKHELMHAYQDQLPLLKNTIAGITNKIPFIKDRIGVASMEIEARMVEGRRKKSIVEAIKKMVYNAPHYIKNYEGSTQQTGFKLLKTLGDKIPKLKGDGQV